MILALGVLVGLLFLEETHERKKHRRDVGVEIGKCLLKRFNAIPEPARVITMAKGNFENREVLPEDDAPPGYRTTEGSPRQSSSRSQSPNVVPTDLRFSSRSNSIKRTEGVRKAFTKQVILNIVGFGLLA